MKNWFLLLFLLFGIGASAQEFGFRFFPTDVPVRLNDRVLANAWAGGLNSAQFWKIDLNANGIEDLVVFDRTNQKISTFITEGKNYRYAPRYEQLFPSDIQNWLQLVDYDLDGKKDLFTFTPQGIRLFRNISTNGSPQWQLVADPLYSVGFSGKINLYVASTDIPAIVDVDNDGDIDVLTFDFTGNYVEYHKNFSVEEKKPTEFIFRKQGFCWGNFFKEHCKDFRFDIDCQTGQIVSPTPSNARVAHAGNSLLLADITGDNKNDVLFGHITCLNLAMLPNTGTMKDATFNSALYDYPAKDPINFSVFPAVYFDDFDNDGQKDLLASPNVYTNEGNLVNFEQSAWLYRNAGTPTAPNYVQGQKDFLQNTMLDVGENASPAFADIDGDGDQDLLVGIGGKQTDTKGYRGSIWQFKNVGSTSVPSFELQTNDFLGIAATEQLFDLTPFFADFDGDGVRDLGLISNSFKGFEARFVPNKAKRNEAMQLDWKNATVVPFPEDTRYGDNPLFYDLDADGDLDLLVGKTFGNIVFYRNNGSSQKPNFQLETEEFGGIKGDEYVRNISLQIADLNGDYQPELIVADGEGYLKIFTGLETPNVPMKPFSNLLFDEATQQFANLKIGGRLQLAFTDLNNDKLPDLAVGTNTGGIRLLLNSSLPKIPPKGSEALQVFPNPANQTLFVVSSADSDLTLYSVLGHQIAQKAVEANQRSSFDVSGLSDGLYLIKSLALDGTSQVIKVWVRK